MQNLFSTILEHEETGNQPLHGNELIRLVPLSNHGARPAHDGRIAKAGKNARLGAKDNMGRFAAAPGLRKGDQKV